MNNYKAIIAWTFVGFSSGVTVGILLGLAVGFFISGCNSRVWHMTADGAFFGAILGGTFGCVAGLRCAVRGVDLPSWAVPMCVVVIVLLSCLFGSIFMRRGQRYISEGAPRCPPRCAKFLRIAPLTFECRHG
jgi:hypothetical protein